MGHRLAFSNDPGGLTQADQRRLEARPRRLVPPATPRHAERRTRPFAPRRPEPLRRSPRQARVPNFLGTLPRRAQRRRPCSPFPRLPSRPRAPRRPRRVGRIRCTTGTSAPAIEAGSPASPHRPGCPRLLSRRAGGANGQHGRTARRRTGGRRGSAMRRPSPAEAGARSMPPWRSRSAAAPCLEPRSVPPRRVRRLVRIIWVRAVSECYRDEIGV